MTKTKSATESLLGELYKEMKMGADSLTDIVQMTNMSYSSISVRLHRTKNKLKNLLTKEGVLV